MKHFLIFYCISEDLLSCLVQISFSQHLYGSRHLGHLVHAKLQNLFMEFGKIFHYGFFNLGNHNYFIDKFIAKYYLWKENFNFGMF